MQDLIRAVALILILEGLLYAGFPNFAKDMMKQMINISEDKLKTIGFITISIGLVLLWTIK